MIIDHPRYTPKETLGQGAQGRVVRVIDRERPALPLVAKVIHTDRAQKTSDDAHGGAADPDADATRLTGEFALLARLRAPGLVRVHDFGRDAQGRVFLIEDLVDGEDAVTAIGAANSERRGHALTSLTADLAETLSALHDAGFVHGDVKPSNIRVTRAQGSGFGRAVLLDLGAAVARGRVKEEDDVIHTPAFAAPEVRAGARPSPLADLFGLGATLWTCAAPKHARPRAGIAEALRDHAPWVPPSLATLIASLLAEHPADRPSSARETLALLGRLLAAGRLGQDARSPSAPTWEAGGTRTTHVRENDVRRVLALQTNGTGRRVVYISGPSGAGKSHLVREVMTRALLDGRQARLVGQTDWTNTSGLHTSYDPTFTARLVAYLRGADSLFQDDGTSTSAKPFLIVLDDLHAASAEVVEAVESFRCMMQPARRPVLIVATTRKAPERAETLDLGPLDDDVFERLCREENVQNPREMARQAGGLPGWLFAAMGRVPLTREAALARIASLSEGAKHVLALVATLSGTVPHRVLRGEHEEGLAVCFEAGLLERERDAVRLASAHLAADLSVALASYPISDRATAIALADEALPAAALSSIARSPCPPERRSDLLIETAARALREEARSLEIEALLALVADPAQRTGERLLRLERLTRDAGSARAHPQVLAWLIEVGEKEAMLAPLVERRRAEERARAGDMSAARAAADHALELSAGRVEEIYALATRGSIHLWCAEWASAADRFSSARALVEKIEKQQTPQMLDREEIARLEHNVGVVALYRGRADEAAEAFERSVVIKRALGDRVGVRACLLNLGLALPRLERYPEAEAALVEATALADALGEPLGRGWCLAARADLEVRRKRAREAERYVAEAEAMGDVIPKTIRADLVILRAQIALLEGDGRAALDAVARIDIDIRREDALVDARALALDGRSRLCLLPADRRGAARAAIASIRRAREGDFPDAEREARDLLDASRGRSRRAGAAAAAAVAPTEKKPMSSTTAPKPSQEAGPDPDFDAQTWDVLRALGSDSSDACVMKLATLVVRTARAERALIAEIDDDSGAVVRAWGVDLDGLAIAEAAMRVDVETVRAARTRAGTGVLYQPEVTMSAGLGSRLALARGQTAIIVEHRFRASAFDHVNESTCERWLTMGEIALRLDARSTGATMLAEHQSHAASSSPAPFPSSSSSSSHHDPRVLERRMIPQPHESTAMPRRESLREFPGIVGKSVALRRALAQLDAAVDADLPVLIEGETGTGKEVFARALHDHGPRRSAPFVAVNCAAIADSLFEAELFGHSRGAFTGADRARGGLLARAEGGTLLLDEMGELALARQATLLRVLEERRYRPVGSDDDRAFDVRVVAATNRDLDQAVEEGTFRKDLLYRLRVLRVVVPPLRDRRGDVQLLLRHFLARAGSRAQISNAASELLESYMFPGNVRELQHLAQRLAASRLERVDVANLPREVRAAGPVAGQQGGSPTSRDDSEREEVENALSRTGGNISRAAGLLGLTRHGLKKRMLRLGLRAKQSGS